MLLTQRPLRQCARIGRALVFSCSTSTSTSYSTDSLPLNYRCAHAKINLRFRQQYNGQSCLGRYSTSTTVLPNSRARMTGTDRVERFELLKQPQILLPSFDVGRRLANFFHQTYYMMRHEKEFSVQGFLRGAEQAVPLMADYLVKEDWQQMKSLTQPDLLTDLRRLRANMSPSDVDCLKFEPDDVVSSFVFASLITKEWKLKRMLDTSRTIFVNHAVVYVLKGEKEWLQKHPRPSPARLLSQQKDNLLVCNIQFARVVHPVLAGWRITSLNFFDPP